MSQTNNSAAAGKTGQQAKDTAKATASKATAETKATTDDAADAFFEMPSALHDIADRTAGQARVGYEAYKSMAEDATEAMEDTLANVNKGAGEMQRQALMSAKAQMNANFDFAEKLLAARSLSEAVELQSGFMRQQFELMQQNTREFQALAQRMQQETSKPFAGGMGRMFGQWLPSA